MNIERETAITLRVTPFSNTSSVITWFGAQQGRFATLAKGAQRPRSRFLGQADMFYTCEILYYPGHNRRRLAILKECAPLETRNHFRENWRATLCASYAGMLLMRICPERAPHPALYRLLGNYLDALATGSNRTALLFWYELRVLSEMGLSPNLKSCTRCGKPGIPDKAQAFFSAAAGGLLCSSCLARYANDVTPVTAGITALLANWQRATEPSAARRTAAARSQVAQLEHVIGGFLQHHLDALYPGRGLAIRNA